MNTIATLLHFVVEGLNHCTALNSVCENGKKISDICLNHIAVFRHYFKCNVFYYKLQAVLVFCCDGLYVVTSIRYLIWYISKFQFNIEWAFVSCFIKEATDVKL